MNEIVYKKRMTELENYTNWFSKTLKKLKNYKEIIIVGKENDVDVIDRILMKFDITENIVVDKIYSRGGGRRNMRRYRID